MIRDLFLNLPVADLPATKTFFATLGFEFDPRFTNDDAACMVINEHAFVMLLQRSFFQTFTKLDICDTRRSIEGLFAFDTDSRASVDALMETAIDAGATEARDPSDYGFMYSRSFLDLDGHQWEVIWMDMEQFLAAQSATT